MTHVFEAEVLAQPVEISDVTSRILGYLEQQGVDARAAHHVAMAIEEILTNVGTHGGRADLPAIVRVTVGNDNVDGEVLDRGMPFDPRAAPQPDFTQPVEARTVGGLGLHLLRQLATRVDYDRQGEANRTIFSVARTNGERR